MKVFFKGLDVYRLCKMQSEPWDIIKTRTPNNPFAKKAKFLLAIVFNFLKKVFRYQGA